MLRIRLIAFVTLVALLAPWAAPCLMTESGNDAAMPCCHRTAPVGPAARACCAPEGRQPALPTAQTAPAVHAQPGPMPLPAMLTTIPQALRAMSRPHVSVRPPSSSAVLLI